MNMADKRAEPRTIHRFKSFWMQEMNWEITSVIGESRVGEWGVVSVESGL